MRDIVIIGAGGFGREVKCLIEAINTTQQKYNIVGFIDDSIEVGTEVHQYKVIGGLNHLISMKSKPEVVIAVGHPPTKKTIYDKIKDYTFPSLIHPSVSMNGTNLSIGKGVIICQGTIITCDIKISDFVTLNLACTIGHDTIIGAFSSCMPGVNISGEVIMKDAVYIGTGATIINQLEIGENTIIGAGALVSKTLPSNCTAVGVPAKPIKFN